MNLSKNTVNRINKTIAEILGLENIHYIDHVLVYGGVYPDIWSVPDYFRDLNACAKFEEFMDDMQHGEYRVILSNLAREKFVGTLLMSGAEYRKWFSSPAHYRCMAFIIVMFNVLKWEELIEDE